MNAVVTPSVASRTEVNEMSSMANWTISYQKSAPHFKPIQDSVMGSFQLTRSETRLDKYHAMRFFANTAVKPDFSQYSKDHVFTGREVVSKVLPSINYTGRTNYYNDNFKPYINYDMNETKIVIDHGVLQKGVFDKSAAKIYTIIENEHGPRQSLDTMFNIQQLSIAHILINGFTAGIGDIMLPRETFDEMHTLISKVVTESNLIADRLIRREIIPPLGYTTEQYYERLQTAILKQDCVEPIMKVINPETNGLFMMNVTGSKGEWANLQHILAWVGQVLINGKRVMQNFSYKRTSPYNTRFDTSPESRGFVPNSYIGGLESSQYVFSAMAARIDLIGKSLGTAVSGAQSRTSVKNLEPIVISNNRFAEKTEYIVQFSFGDDGVDPRKVENVVFPTVMISDQELEEQFKYVAKNKELAAVFEREFNQIKEDRAMYRRVFMHMENLSIGQQLSNEKLLPVNVRRIFNDMIHENKDNLVDADEKTIAEMVSKVNAFCDNLPYVFMNPIQEQKKGYVQPYNRNALKLLCMYVRSVLCANNLKKINHELLDAILLKCRLKLLNSLIEYGSPIGVISAVCMSEPTTQLSLKSIHLKDSDTTTQKAGIWRIKEILSVKPTEACFEPMMTMELKPGTTEERAREIANNIEIMELGKFVHSWQIFFEEYAKPIHPAYQKDLEIFKEFNRVQGVKPPSDLLRWCTRFVLDRYSMIFKNMPLEVIINKLRSPNLFIVHSNENAPEIIIRVYYRSGSDLSTLKKVREMTESLMNLNVRGIDKIISSKVDSSIIRHVVQPDGSLKSQKVLTIVTNGVNLPGIFALQRKIPEIDYASLQTDAIRDTERTFGIDATRQKIVTELRGVLSDINYRHYTLLDRKSVV